MGQAAVMLDRVRAIGPSWQWLQRNVGFSRREFMEETYRDTSVSNSLDDAVGRLGFRL